MTGRPGFRTSEFIVTVLNVIAQIVLALTNTLSDGTATRLGVAGALAYIVSRGLAKTETRSTSG